ncbi:MAG: M23 family metallopeptidase [Anaerolineae bacterium]|nr:M23 family metallopeptidase [Anaerolineae bacterium]
MAHTVFIRGIPDNPSIVDVRVWMTPGMDSSVRFRAKVNTTAITDQIAPDDRGTAFMGQVYRWFHLLFPDGRDGWVRDDLLDIQGDFTPFGYGNYARRTFAFVAAQSVPLASIKTPTPIPAGTPVIAPDNTPAPIVIVAPSTGTMPATVMICTGSVLETVQPEVRKLPSAAADSVGSLPPKTAVQIFGVTPTADADGVRWVQVVGGGLIGYVRSDVLNYAPECAQLGLPSSVSQPVVPVVPPVRQPICTGKARLDLQPNIRSAPSFQASKKGMLQPGDPVNIFSVVPGQDGDGFRWVEITSQAMSGFVREDLLTYTPECNVLSLFTSQPSSGTTQPVPLNTGGKFAAPVQKVVITQEFGTAGHKGTDFGLKVGSAVTASGDGTAFVIRCQRCRDDAPNFLSQGITDADAANYKRNLNDPAWGYGFGNAVMVRYVWEALPPDMRAVMTQRGLTNGAAYVIHGHLSRIDVGNGQAVSKGTQLGLSGNTGNSSGPHLHLELRLSADAKATTIEGIFGKLVENPRSLYSF